MGNLRVLVLSVGFLLVMSGCGRRADLPPDLRPIAITGTYGVGFKVRGHEFWMVQPYSGLWLVDPYSGRLSRLIKMPQNVSPALPRYSPAGDKVSFWREYELFVVDVATKETKTLGDTAFMYAWYDHAWYDRDHILWVQRSEERDPDGYFLWRLMLTDVAGESRVLLTTSQRIWYFTSDAKAGIVVYGAEKLSSSGDQERTSGIFILPIEDGAHSEPCELKLDTPPIYASPFNFLLGEGGQYLLYRVVVREGEPPWRSEVRIARLAGTKVLSSSETEIPPNSLPFIESPKGKDTLFASEDGCRLFLMTSGKRVYLSQPRSMGMIGYDAAWSQDGSLVAYLGIREVVSCPIPSTTIHIVDKSGKRIKELTLRRLAADGIAWEHRRESD